MVTSCRPLLIHLPPILIFAACRSASSPSSTKATAFHRSPPSFAPPPSHLCRTPTPGLRRRGRRPRSPPTSPSSPMPNSERRRDRIDRGGLGAIGVGGGFVGGGGGGCDADYDDDADATAVRVFLRFSPLIGGPSFLPLHVEVIFALSLVEEEEKDARDFDAEGETEEEEEEEPNAMMDAIHVAWDDVGFPYSSSSSSSSSSSAGALAPHWTERGISAMHRFDFLPSGDPTDPATLRRLLTLGGVPGRVRHRIHHHHRGRRRAGGGARRDDDRPRPAAGWRGEVGDGEGGREKREERGGGLAILVPVGSIASPRRRYDCEVGGGGGGGGGDDGRGGGTSPNGDAVVDAAAKFNGERGGGSSSSFDELRVFGGKNCLSFALDLLSHVDAAFGIRSCDAMTTFPPRIHWA